MSKCCHPDCNEKGIEKFGIVSRWGYEKKIYCSNHVEYAYALSKKEIDRIFPNGKIIFSELITAVDATIFHEGKMKRVAKANGYVVNAVVLSKRERIYQRDGNKCLACGSTEYLTLDHIVPSAIGGGNDEDNLQTLCYSCNMKKGCRIRDYRIQVLAH